MSSKALLNKLVIAALLALPVWVGLAASAPFVRPWQILHHPGRAFLLVLLYPLLEEIAFRGLLQGYLLRLDRLKKSLFGISAANLLTSLVFVLFHLFNHNPLWAAGVLFPSLLFGYFRDQSGDIKFSILLHTWYNAGYFLLFWP